MQGKVIRTEIYGHALLDLTGRDLRDAGIGPGDIVAVTAGRYTGEIPCLNGYYAESGEGMVRILGEEAGIALCINYGNFTETAGIGAGDTVTLTLKEKAGALLLQEINNLEYTDERGDYASDEIFANFRPVKEGILYRSASPLDDMNGRAAFANRLMHEAGIRTVLNLADTDEEIRAFLAGGDDPSPLYRELFESGRVMALSMPIHYASDDFGEGIVKGVSFLAEHESPYLIHCTEGKDRAGFAVMILEALMGWDEKEIVTDYMTSFVNYYGIRAGTEKYHTIAEKNVKEMLRFTAGLEKGASLEGTDLRRAAETYLTGCGMDGETLRKLETRLGH